MPRLSRSLINSGLSLAVAVSALVLNPSVAAAEGIDPVAVESSSASGADMSWFPGDDAAWGPLDPANHDVPPCSEPSDNPNFNQVKQFIEGPWYIPEPNEEWDGVTHHWFRNCVDDSTSMSATIKYNGGDDFIYRDVCLPPGSAIYVGYFGAGPDIGRWSGTFHREWRGGCLDEDDNPIPPTPAWPWPAPGEQLPTATVAGSVFTLVNDMPGAREVPVTEARFELKYFGHKNIGDDPDWHYVRENVDENGIPTGNPIVGYLTGNEYDITFNYPSSSGAWMGCLPQNDGVTFGGSHACADEHLVLEIYAQSLDDSARVEVQVSDQPEFESVLIESIPLGRFFERSTDKTVSTSDAAFAYGSIISVRDFVSPGDDEGAKTERVGDVLIEFVDSQSPIYDRYTKTVYMDPRFAGATAAEHEVAHSYTDHHYQARMPDPENCNEHYFTKPSSAQCAWIEGFANFVATAAEAGGDQSEPLIFWWADGDGFNLENCEYLDQGRACQNGDDVEGRVIGALGDLYDTMTGFPDRENGFYDRVSYDPQYILRVVERAVPDTFDQFWHAWRLIGPENRDPVADRIALFRNTLGDSKILDDDDAGMTSGVWASEQCVPCTGGDLARSAEGEMAEAEWRLDSILPGGSYDVFVRLPNGDSGLDPNTQYLIENGGKLHSVTVDQAATSDGWVHLNSTALESFKELPTTLRVVGDSDGAPIVIDSVVVAPYESW